MKTEEHAWQRLRDHASAQLRPDFAGQVLRAAHGPQAAAWEPLFAHAAAQIRPGFAERVLRAARDLKANVPSLFDQFAFSAATAAVCVLAAVIVHSRSAALEDERNLAQWQQIAQQVADVETSR